MFRKDDAPQPQRLQPVLDIQRLQCLWRLQMEDCPSMVGRFYCYCNYSESTLDGIISAEASSC